MFKLAEHFTISEVSPAAHLSTNGQPLCVSVKAAVPPVHVHVAVGLSWRRPFLHFAERGFAFGRDPGPGGVVDAAGTCTRAHGPRVPQPREQTGNHAWFTFFFGGQSIGQ